MWTCPKCGRSFKRINQSHYCGDSPKTITEYINLQPEEYQSFLNDFLVTIKKTVPNAKEKILWSMPYIVYKEKSISFSACKKHISFYVGVEAINHFALYLNDLDTKKGAIYFPYNHALPIDLIEQISKWCLN